MARFTSRARGSDAAGSSPPHLRGEARSWAAALRTLALGALVAVTACSGGGDGPSSLGGNEPGPGNPTVINGDLVLTATVSSSPPANVSILFEATDREGDPVSTLLTEGTIELLENGQVVSPFESRQRIQPIGRRVAFPTLLLLDLSGSIVGSGNLESLKQSAIQFVDTILDPSSPNAESREIAVAFFPGNSLGRGIRIVSDFSTDRALIRQRIEAVVGAPDTTTNLNEAILRSLERLDARAQEILDTTEVGLVEGALAVFTDGTDRAGTVTTQEVLTALDQTSNSVFTIGLQGEIDTTVLQSFGRSGFVLVENIQNLQTRFSQVAAQIQSAANRFYAVEYCSPKRSGTHELQVVARLGSITGSTTTTFDASGFRAGCRVPEAAIELTSTGGAVWNDVEYAAADGAFVLGGTIGGNANFLTSDLTANSPTEAVLARVLPPAGNGQQATEVFTRVLNGNGRETLDAVATDGGGNSFAAGTFDSTLTIGTTSLIANAGQQTGYVASFAIDGSPRWARDFGGSGTHSIAAIEHRDGDVVIAGTFDGAITCDGQTAMANGEDLFLAFLDAATGACNGLITGGGAGSQRPRCLDARSDGTLVVGGEFLGSMQFGTFNANASGSAGFALAFDASGAEQWLTAIPGSPVDSILFDRSNGVAIGGRFSGNLILGPLTVQGLGPNSDGYLVTLDRVTGLPIRGTALGDSSGAFSTTVTDLASDGLGNVYAATMQADSASGDALTGFSVFLPSGQPQLDYLFATDLSGPTRFALGPLGIDQAALTAPFAREASFGPFPLRYDEAPQPGSPLSGRQSFVGFVGPRS